MIGSSKNETVQTLTRVSASAQKQLSQIVVDSLPIMVGEKLWTHRWKSHRRTTIRCCCCYRCNIEYLSAADPLLGWRYYIANISLLACWSSLGNPHVRACMAKMRHPCSKLSAQCFSGRCFLTPNKGSANVYSLPQKLPRINTSGYFTCALLSAQLSISGRDIRSANSVVQNN